MINEKDFLFDSISHFNSINQNDRLEVKVGDYSYEIDFLGNVYFKTKCDLDRLDNESISFEKYHLKGVVDNDGKVLIPPKHSCNFFSAGASNCYSFYQFNKNNEFKYGLIDRNGNVKVPAVYDDIRHLGENYYVARSTEGYGVIDDNGRIILPFEYDTYLFYFWNEEKDKFIADKKETKKCGVANTENEVIIPFIYNYIDTCFKSGRYKNCAIAKKNGKVGIINEKNEIIIPFEYKRIVEFSAETFVVSKDMKVFTVVDNKFNKIADIKHNGIHLNDTAIDYYITCDKKGRFGLTDKYGNLAIDLKYKKLKIIDSLFQNDKLYLLAQNKQGKCGIIDINENVIVPFEYDYYSSIRIEKENPIRVEKDYTTVMIKNEKYGIINIKDNSVILDFVFDEIYPFNDKETTLAKYKGKWGIINKKGEALKYDLENARNIIEYMVVPT